MIPSSYDIPLHDIKPLMDVPDSSGSFLLLLMFVALIIFMGLAYLLYQRIRSIKRLDRRKYHYKILQKIDFSDPKRAAYMITEHGRFFADDSERLYEAYQNLIERLERYKYRKEVSPIDDESRSYYKIYLEMIDV